MQPYDWGNGVLQRVADREPTSSSMTQPIDGAATGIFAPRPEAIPVARDFVRRDLLARGANTRLSDAVLLASELVTNSVSYGRGDVAVTVEATSGKVRVAVGHASQDPSTPHLARPGPDGLGGQGLHIVDRLAARWGTERNQDGYQRVWFELAPP